MKTLHYKVHYQSYIKNVLLVEKLLIDI